MYIACPKRIAKTAAISVNTIATKIWLSVIMLYSTIGLILLIFCTKLEFYRIDARSFIII